MGYQQNNKFAPKSIFNGINVYKQNWRKGAKNKNKSKKFKAICRLANISNRDLHIKNIALLKQI